MKPFEIFRTGRHTSSQGASLTFGDAELAAIVAGYDPALHHAPIVVGHPKQDAPAYGWVAGLSIEKDRLIAVPADVDAAFSDLVKDGKFKARSAAFYQPDAPNNPTPGKYYLRHVGFLGATAPAVKGLKPVEFGDDTLFVEFADSTWRQAWAMEAAARLFRGMRDFFIETRDIETADRILPDFEISQLAQTAAELRAEENASHRSTFTDPTKGPTMKTPEQLTAELQAREADITRRETAFAEQAKKDRATADAAFVDGVVKAGRLPIGLQAQATALFADLGEGELTFSDGAEQKKTTPRAAFRDLLDKLPVPVVTKELAGGEGGPDFSDPLQVAAAIATEIKSAADKGETISPSDAVARLEKKRSK